MLATVPATPGDRFLATRASLLGRLANWQDQVSWSAFFDLYWRLLYSVALKSGLQETEAEEAVQETILAVAHNIGKFRYDPARGSFKSWLLKIARTKIVDQFRKRDAMAASLPDDFPQTRNAIDEVWDTEWRENLLDAALTVLRKQVDPLQFQIFDCYVIKNWEPGKVAQAVGVSVGQVYLAKNRIAPKLKAIVERLERDGT